MKYLMLSLIIMISGCSSTPYWSGTLGHKFNEAVVYGSDICSSKISISGEIGAKFKEIYNGTIIGGVAHHSQPSCGRPFNDQWEPSKSEAFIRYEKELEWWWN